MKRDSIDNTATRLSGLSAHARGKPARCFEWRASADRDHPAQAHGLLSLAGHPLLAQLSDEQRWRLGLAEMTHFFSLNIAGERMLLEGLGQQLAGGHCSGATSGYLRHVIEEECAHTEVFETFCRRYAGKTYRDRQLRFPRRLLPGEAEFLVFAQMLVFEEISAWFNRKLAADRDVWPLVRDINEYHAAEEARHLVFGRAMVESLWEASSPGWAEEGRARIAKYVRAYVRSTLRSYVDPDVYVDAGVPGDAFALREEVLASDGWRQIEAAATKRLDATLTGLGMAR